ncbi:hypothetical protein [Roseomonas sp. WA12]
MVTTRRGVMLGGGAVLLGTPALAQGGPLLELHGRLTAASSERFARAVSDAMDGRISLQVTAPPAEGRVHAVTLQAPLLLIQAEKPERMQISLTGGYTLRDSAFVLDGVYDVKGEGMQQGILIYVLSPVSGGEGRRLRDGQVRRLELG